MKALIIPVSRRKKSACFVLFVLVIYLSTLSSSPCPSLSSLYGKKLYSPCSLALAIWIGSSSKGHNGRGLEGRQRRKGLVFPPLSTSSVISHLVSWSPAPKSQLWTRILSMVGEPLCPGSSNTTSSYSLLVLMMTMGSCCCSSLDCPAIPGLTSLLYQNLFTNSLY